MHLTNYAINKNNESFVQSQGIQENSGHKRSLSSALNYLNSLGHDTQKLWEDIKLIILKTLFCIQPKLAHTYKACQPNDFSNEMCFEILGFDIIIDSNMTPWLLEVNHSPSFNTDSPLDLMVKTSVVEGAFQLLNISHNNRKEYEEFKKKKLFLRTFYSNKEDIREQKRLEGIFNLFRREQWEGTCSGPYEIVYPLQNGLRKYERLLSTANDLWERWTGVANSNRAALKLPIGTNKKTGLLATILVKGLPSRVHPRT